MYLTGISRLIPVIKFILVHELIFHYHPKES